MGFLFWLLKQILFILVPEKPCIINCNNYCYYSHYLASLNSQHILHGENPTVCERSKWQVYSSLTALFQHKTQGRLAYKFTTLLRAEWANQSRISFDLNSGVQITWWTHSWEGQVVISTLLSYSVDCSQEVCGEGDPHQLYLWGHWQNHSPFPRLLKPETLVTWPRQRCLDTVRGANVPLPQICHSPIASG